MSKEKMKKATLEALMARAQQSEMDKMKCGEFISKELEMAIPFRRIPAKKFADILDMGELLSGGDAEKSLIMAVEMIYEAVPMLHEKALLEAYECGEPTDIVVKIFNDNYGEIMAFSDAISQLCGFSDQVDGLKN